MSGMFLGYQFTCSMKFSFDFDVHNFAVKLYLVPKIFKVLGIQSFANVYPIGPICQSCYNLLDYSKNGHPLQLVKHYNRIETIRQLSNAYRSIE